MYFETIRHMQMDNPKPSCFTSNQESNFEVSQKKNK